MEEKMIQIEKLKEKIDKFQENVFSLKGQLDLLKNQLSEKEIKQVGLEDLQIINKKSIELLNLVQNITKESTKNVFEGVISRALCYIQQSDDYRFELEFDKRKNTPELRYNIKTPELQQFHNIMDTSAGGNREITVLAMREVLLEITKKKGLLFLDEPFKRLGNPELVIKAMEFIKEVQQKTGRQIFIISHRQEVIDFVPSPIILVKK